MATGAGCDGDQTVGTLFDGLFGELVIDDVVHDDAAIAVDRLVDVFAGAQ